MSRDEIYAGFLQNMSRSRELFEIIQNENARKRHRVHIALVNGSGVMGFVNVAMSNKKRDGEKRKIAKDISVAKGIN